MGKMRLIDEWNLVLKRAWSIRFIIMAGAFSGLEMALPFFSDAVPRHVFAVLSMLACGFALYFRIMAQPKMRDPKKSKETDDEQDPA